MTVPSPLPDPEHSEHHEPLPPETAPGTARSRALENLSLREQLGIDRLPLRLVLLMTGLTGFGVSIAMLIRGGLGVAPWDVFHVALAARTPFTVGTVLIAISFVVLLLWIPLRQHPGIGTLLNAVWVGVAADLALAVLPSAEEISPSHGLAVGISLMLGAILVNAISSAIYIGAQLGPGPRDGLMTGLNRRFGWPIGRSRLLVEGTVLLSGWLLGGPIGIGTVLYAIGIGPLCQVFLPYTIVPVRSRPGGAGPAGAVQGSEQP